MAAPIALAQQPVRPGADELHISSQAYRLGPLVFTANTNTVATDVIVRDQAGQPVDGLHQGNFRILDNGQPQTIARFAIAHAAAAAPPVAASANPTPAASTVASPPAQPRYLALFFDDVNTNVGDLAHARIAAQRFANQALGPGDHVAVLTASSQQGLDFTTDRSRLLATVAAIRPHPRAAATPSAACLRLTTYQAYLIVNHLDPSAMNAAMAEEDQCEKQVGIFNNSDGGMSAYTKGQMPSGSTESSEVVMVEANSVWSASRAVSEDTLQSLEDAVDAMGHEPGTRVLVVASGGFLSGTLGGEQDAIVEHALRDQVTINVLDAKGLYSAIPSPEDDITTNLERVPVQMYAFLDSAKLSQHDEERAGLAYIAQSSGGLMFENNNDLSLGFSRLGLAPAVTYTLSFSPANLVRDGKFHALKAEVTPDHHYAVQSRRGYFAPAPATGPSLDPSAVIAAAMRAKDETSVLPARTDVRAAGGEARVYMRLDLHDLPFRKINGREQERLTLVAGLFTPAGAMVTAKRATMEFALKDATWKAMLAQGLDTNLSLAAPTGAYTLRCVILEANAGKLFSSSSPVSVSR